MTLTEFLLARIAEDEAVAREVEALVAPAYRYEDAEGSAASIHWDDDYSQGGYTITAARALSECEAKRRIVERYAHLIDHGDSADARWVLPLLALPYAGHEGYDQAWAV